MHTRILPLWDPPSLVHRPPYQSVPPCLTHPGSSDPHTRPQSVFVAVRDMPPCSGMLQRPRASSSGSSDYGHGFQSRQVLVKSPPPSPGADRKVKPSSEPWPYIPSSNPASQYTLLEKLGTGSFGVVYKAIHNETKQIVAIKQIGSSAFF